mmetsp:Transcript_7868/g.31937  ORF Transcript_7868/g.31937 Transcript_7868/m.31937 type:complete len:203 (-) Transcript_7868:594-1202(-)
MRYRMSCSVVTTGAPGSSASLSGSRRWLKRRGKTQQGTSAKGFPSSAASSTIESVAWSGCMPTTAEHARILAAAAACSGASPRQTSGERHICSESGTPSPFAPPRALTALCCSFDSLGGRGSTTVEGTPCVSLNSNDTSPRPPATSSTPLPPRRVSIPSVSTANDTNIRARADLRLAPPAAACGSPAAAAACWRRARRAATH